MEKKKKRNNLTIGLIALVSLFIIVSLAGLFLLQPAPEIIQGQVEATQIRISGKLPGRVAEIMVEEGESVEAGDTLIYIFVDGRSPTIFCQCIARCRNSRKQQG